VVPLALQFPIAILSITLCTRKILLKTRPR